LRIGYLMGAMGRGGAQLQLLHLTAGLVSRGHEVEVLAYVRESELDDLLRSTGADLTVDVKATRLGKWRRARRWLALGRFDVVHAVMVQASSLALLARWPARRPPVVATDFSTATFDGGRLSARLLLATYALADAIVTETEVNHRHLGQLVPASRAKTHVIRNGIDAERFAPASVPPAAGRPFTFCVVASVYGMKNPGGVIDAIAELRERGHIAFHVDWYGRMGMPGSEQEGRDAVAHALARGVAGSITFHGDTVDVERAYRSSDALLLASFREGFPNAVSEGMACGLPIVVSDVSDLPQVVAEASNGYLLDPTDPSSIADAMERMMQTPVEERAAMGRRSREVALRWFSMDRFVDRHEALYREVIDRAI